MGVDFLNCAKCDETFPDCGPHKRCSKCESVFCPDCMEEVTDDSCPLCRFEVIADDTLLAFLLNHLGITREEAEDKARKKWRALNGEEDDD